MKIADKNALFYGKEIFNELRDVRLGKHQPNLRIYTIESKRKSTGYKVLQTSREGDCHTTIHEVRSYTRVWIAMTGMGGLLCRSALPLVDRSRDLEPMGEDVMDDCTLRDGDAGDIFGIFGDEAQGFLL